MNPSPFGYGRVADRLDRTESWYVESTDHSGLPVMIGEMNQAERNGVLASLVGFPAIPVPAGFSTPTESAPIGVPVGIEFLGPPFSEPQLLQITYGSEQATHVNHRNLRRR